MREAFFWWVLALIIAIVLAATDTRAALKPDIKRVAIEQALKHNIDPALVLAIIRVESGGRTHVIGRANEIGLMQLKPQYHGEGASFNYIKNIKAGVKYLASIKARHGGRYPNSWFVFYNVGPNKKLADPKKVAYYRKITKELEYVRGRLPANYIRTSEGNN
jgi:soluble lytic murein transglycosylase-like protein